MSLHLMGLLFLGAIRILYNHLVWALSLSTVEWFASLICASGFIVTHFYNFVPQCLKKKFNAVQINYLRISWLLLIFIGATLVRYLDSVSDTGKLDENLYLMAICFIVWYVFVLLRRLKSRKQKGVGCSEVTFK